MTRTKRILACLIAALLVLPLLCSPALADEGYTFVVQNNNTGYEYLLYQIFTGTPSKDAAGNTVLSDIEWGNGVKDDTKTKVYDMFNLERDDRNPTKVAEMVAANANNDVFHTILANLGTNNGESLTNAISTTKSTYNVTVDGQTEIVSGYGATNLAPGYYLVRNTAVPNGATYSDYIVKVVGGDVVSEPKAAVPSSQKKHRDVNDSLSATLSASQDSSDYDIGDTIPFTLTATLPTNYANFSTVPYRLIFVDDLSAGLTWDGSATIYYGASDTTGATVNFTNPTTVQTVTGETIKVESSYSGGTVMALDIANLKETKPGLQGGDVITVKYNATLNASATVGSFGNRNTYTVYYSNDPTSENHVGSTTPDTNVVFTYKTVFNKTDENGSPLTGADFKLEKFVANQNGAVTVGGIKGVWVDVAQLHTDAGAANPRKTGSTAGSTFEFAGLDDGTYRLTETTTPAGYNSIDPIQFTISAEHEASSAEPRLISLTGTDGAQFTMTSNLDQASLTANIQNKPGLVLPNTGGLGTKALAGVGAVLLIGSAVLLVTRRRMRVE